MPEQDKPNDSPSLIRFPFALPDQFVAKIGYLGQDPLVGMFWQGAGDELTVYDRAYIWTGMHNHAVYQDVIHQPRVRGWLNEFLINLGSSQYPETHHLIVDRTRNEAFVVPRGSARLIVRRGSFDEEETNE